MYIHNWYYKHGAYVCIYTTDDINKQKKCVKMIFFATPTALSLAGIGPGSI